MAKPGFLDYHRVSNLWQTCFLIFTFLTIAANVSAGPGPGPGPGPEDIDYRTEGLATAPGGLTAGQLVTFSATVKNYGGDPEGIPSQTRLRLDIDNNGTWDFTPADQTTGGLTSVGSANDSEVETWSSVWTATAGTHLFEVCADVELIITETNEGNNCTTQTFTVLPAVTYNLTVNSSGASSVVITSSSGHGGTTNYTRSALAAGANVSLTAPATSGGNNYSSWSGCDSVLGNTCSVSMNAAKTVTVTYTHPAQPDYIAEGLATAPGGLTAGQSVTFAATVRNSGAGAASVSSQTNLRLDIDNNGSWDFTPVDQTTGALAAGATEVENWSNAWTAQVGTHLFEVCADAGSAIAETNEGSNCATQTFTVLPAVTYYNLTVNSSGASSVVITSSSGHGGTTNYTRSALAAGANVSLTAPATSGGNNYSSWSGCDSVLGNTCSVSMNAAKTVTVTYTHPAQPDYIAEGLATAPGGLTAGQSVTFAATVRNSGAGAASVSSQTNLRLDIDNNGSWDFTPVDQTTGALAAGATEVENWSNAWTAQVGTHLFEVCADAGSAIAETNEGSNCATQTFTVLPAVTYYNLTVNSSGASSVVITSSSGHGGTTNYTRSALAAGANVSLTAPATSGGNNYSSWSGCDSVLGNTCSVSMNAAKTVTVTYTHPAQPDYIAEGLATAPGGLTAGQSVTFAATVRNSGAGAASVSSQTNLRLDIDNNGSWDFTPVDQTTGALAAGATEVENWSNAWTAQVGTHLFEVCADAGSAIAETNEGSNCATQTFTVLPAVTYYNLTVNSSGASSVVITSSSGHGGTTNYTRSALAAGANVSLTAPATSGGNNYSSWSGCDSVLGNTCSVSMNAAKTVTVTYTPPAQPDYIAEGLATAPGGLTAGQSVTFAATVRNSGAGAASVSSQTNLRLDIDNNGSWDFTPVDQTTGALAAGATEVENWSNAWTAQVGTHLFEVCADAGSAIAETNEGSNCATQTFTVLPAVTYYNLTVNSSGASSVVITSSSGHGGTTNYTRSALAAGANVSLTAPATSGGNNYAGWSGCDSVLAETCSVSMNAAKTVTVTYTPPAQPDYITEGLGVSPGGLT